MFKAFSNSFLVKVTIFYVNNNTHNVQTVQAFGLTIRKNKGSAGANVQNSPLAVTFLFFILFPKSFRSIIKSKDLNFETMD